MISEIIEKWIKGILIDGITGNLSGLFDNVNAKVGEIASDVGSTPQAWNSGIFNMLRSLSETVVLPIAAAILALVMCHELIQMITEKNNMHDFDTSMFFRWIFKSAFAILIVSNTWNIVMGVFDATQSVVNQSSGVIIGETCDRSQRFDPCKIQSLIRADQAAAGLLRRRAPHGRAALFFGPELSFQQRGGPADDFCHAAGAAVRSVRAARPAP